MGRVAVGLLLPGLALLAAAPASAQPAPPDLTNARSGEDYGYLRDPANRTGAWWEPFKFIPLDPSGMAFLTLGADLRLRYERYQANLWGGADRPDDAYGWLRVMPYAGLQLGPDLRLFGQLVGAWSASVDPAPGPVDETGADLLQGFAQGKIRGADGTLTLQGGRQLLAYGSERLIGLRFGPNVPQAFDGALARLEAGPWRVDAFLMRPVENGLESFDDRTDGSRKLWSVYATRALPEIGPASGLDLFYIGYGRAVARFEQGTGRETRHTFGARFFGRSGPWRWDLEGHLQVGRFAGGDILAWSAASDVRYTFAGLPFAPFLGLRANAISGDGNPGDRRLGTFNALFPRGKYFGEAGMIGPYNLLNLHPVVGLDLGAGWSLSAAAVFYWRASLGDGVYGNPGNLIRASGGSLARYVGTQGEVVLGWSPARGVEFELAYAVLEPGRFIEETGPSRTVQFVGAEMQVRF
jgi:hypothetical protein